MPKSSTEQAPEKAKFARRCNLLSQYLKQNRNFGGIDLGLTRKPDSDLRFTRKPVLTGQQNASPKSELSEIKAIDFIQKLSDVNFREPEPGISQLTIFFGGKIVVLNELNADKAKMIMEIVNQGTFPSVAKDDRKKRLSDGDDDGDNNSKIISSNSKSSPVIPDLNEPTCLWNTSNDQTRHQNHVVERIARRASLHRFFAKRKERASTRAPYQMNQNVGHPLKQETMSPWLEHGQSLGKGNNSVAAALFKPKEERDKWLEEEKEEEGQCSKDLQLRL